MFSLKQRGVPEISGNFGNFRKFPEVSGNFRLGNFRKFPKNEGFFKNRAKFAQKLTENAQN